eukprot:gene18511-25012_t
MDSQLVFCAVCGVSRASVECVEDGARLCGSCDLSVGSLTELQHDRGLQKLTVTLLAQVHSANKVANRHTRWALCGFCGKQRIASTLADGHGVCKSCALDQPQFKNIGMPAYPLPWPVLQQEHLAMDDEPSSSRACQDQRFTGQDQNPAVCSWDTMPPTQRYSGPSPPLCGNLVGPYPASLDTGLPQVHLPQTRLQQPWIQPQQTQQGEQELQGMSAGQQAGPPLQAAVLKQMKSNGAQKSDADKAMEATEVFNNLFSAWDDEDNINSMEDTNPGCNSRDDLVPSAIFPSGDTSGQSVPAQRFNAGSLIQQENVQEKQQLLQGGGQLQGNCQLQGGYQLQGGGHLQGDPSTEEKSLPTTNLFYSSPESSMYLSASETDKLQPPIMGMEDMLEPDDAAALPRMPNAVNRCCPMLAGSVAQALACMPNVVNSSSPMLAGSVAQALPCMPNAVNSGSPMLAGSAAEGMEMQTQYGCGTFKVEPDMKRLSGSNGFMGAGLAGYSGAASFPAQIYGDPPAKQWMGHLDQTQLNQQFCPSSQDPMSFQHIQGQVDAQMQVLQAQSELNQQSCPLSAHAQGTRQLGWPRQGLNMFGAPPQMQPSQLPIDCAGLQQLMRQQRLALSQLQSYHQLLTQISAQASLAPGCAAGGMHSPTLGSNFSSLPGLLPSSGLAPPMSQADLIPLMLQIGVPAAPLTSHASNVAKEEVAKRGLQYRGEALTRYKQKRMMRHFEKTIRYASRQVRAHVRPRVKGRFVKSESGEGQPLSSVLGAVFSQGGGLQDTEGDAPDDDMEDVVLDGASDADADVELSDDEDTKKKKLPPHDESHSMLHLLVPPFRPGMPGAITTLPEGKWSELNPDERERALGSDAGAAAATAGAAFDVLSTDMLSTESGLQVAAVHPICRPECGGGSTAEARRHASPPKNQAQPAVVQIQPYSVVSAGISQTSNTEWMKVLPTAINKRAISSLNTNSASAEVDMHQNDTGGPTQFGGSVIEATSGDINIDQVELSSRLSAPPALGSSTPACHGQKTSHVPHSHRHHRQKHSALAVASSVAATRQLSCMGSCMEVNDNSVIAEVSCMEENHNLVIAEIGGGSKVCKGGTVEPEVSQTSNSIRSLEASAQ